MMDPNSIRLLHFSIFDERPGLQAMSVIHFGEFVLDIILVLVHD